MLWPAFNELGDLPIGVYRATLAEVIAHFGHGTAQRIAITARLEHIYELARRNRFCAAIHHLRELCHGCTQVGGTPSFPSNPLR